MNNIGVFGISYILYLIFTAVLIGLALYVLILVILVIVFLRLRIAELKRALPPKGQVERQ